MARPKNLGPYVIGKPLGKGGMGYVYAATHEETDDQVAVKALSPQLATAEGFRERFEAEIESLKRLKHPGIVRLFGYGEDSGTLFYAMEIVEGASLEEELRAGRRYTWREVTAIAIQLCQALKHAHDRGIVHRDIKPANILQDTDERVKLADFGIARLFGSTQLTTAGGILGTADFMSPEQADGRPVTDRCDQYSLGSVMYALLAGRPPFRAKTLPEMLQLQRYADPEPVRRYAPRTPKQLENTIGQMLSKSAEDRFPNMKVLAKHLEALTIALSRPAEDDFSVDETMQEPEATTNESEIEIAPTLVAGDQDKESGNTKEAIRLQATYAADEIEDDSGSFSVTDSAISIAEVDENGDELTPVLVRAEPEEAPPQQRFTVVTEEDENVAGRGNIQAWGQAVLGIALLVAVGYGAATLVRPPTADDLYAKLDSALTAEAIGEPEATRKLLDQFIDRFPDDARIADLVNRSGRVELELLERRLKAVTLRREPADSAESPEEQLYLEAMRDAEQRPQAALSQLIALSRLLPSPASDQLSEPQQQLAVLVERRVKDLSERFAGEAERHEPLMKARIEQARQLSASEPARAAEIYRAILALYADRPWAQESVTEVQELLGEISVEE